MDLSFVDTKTLNNTKVKEISNVILIRDGKILLGLRSKDKATYSNCWALPGGHLEVGETPVQAARRELLEELNITILDPFPLSPITLHGEKNTTLFHLFTAECWRGEVKINNSEHSRLNWSSPTEACALDRLALNEYRPYFRAINIKTM